jgi:hypothetical protein
MKKVIFLVIALTICRVAIADEIILNDGTSYVGNILEVDKQSGILKFDIVWNNELVGVVLTLKKEDMVYINRDNKYKNLVKKQISEEEKQQYVSQFESRIGVYSSIDSSIYQRSKREGDRIRETEYFEEAKKQADLEREHELQVEKIRASAEIEAIRLEQQRLNLLRY